MMFEGVEAVTVLSDDELFMFDWNGGRLLALDVRVGDVVGGFKGLRSTGPACAAVYMGKCYHADDIFYAQVFLCSDGTLCYAKTMWDFAVHALLSRLEDAGV